MRRLTDLVPDDATEAERLEFTVFARETFRLSGRCPECWTPGQRIGPHPDHPDLELYGCPSCDAEEFPTSGAEGHEGPTP